MSQTFAEILNQVSHWLRQPANLHETQRRESLGFAACRLDTPAGKANNRRVEFLKR